MFQKSYTREEFWKQQGKRSPKQGNSHKTVGRYCKWNFSSQERIKWYIQHIEWKNYQPRILYTESCSPEMKECYFIEQTKAKRVYHH